MRYLLLTLALVLAIGCGTATPTSPDLDNVYNDYPVLPELELMATARTAQAQMPPGWIPDGSLMTDGELLVYFATHIAEGVLGSDEHPAFCNVYEYFYGCFYDANQLYPPPFTYVRFMVWWMESNSWDVPDVQDAYPPCQ